MRNTLDRGRAMVISASRSRDMVHRCPGQLARILSGEAEVRLARYRKPETLDLRKVGALVLWTKQPAPLLESGQLRSVLEAYPGEVVLQLTVTGFGGSAVEPGIPHPLEVRDALERVLDLGLVEARAVKLRYDPVGTLRFGERVYSNMRIDLFERVLDLFQPLGVARVTSSVLDAVNYPAVAGRIASVGGEVDVEGAEAFMKKLAGVCRDRGLVFSTCVYPYDGDLVEVEGCIDGRLMNEWIREKGGKLVWDALHNEVGAQRKNCLCTYSHDIGYSAGVPMCTSAGFGCVYCYSQGRGLGKVGDRVQALLDSADDHEEWARVATIP